MPGVGRSGRGEGWRMDGKGRETGVEREEMKVDWRKIDEFGGERGQGLR